MAFFTLLIQHNKRTFNWLPLKITMTAAKRFYASFLLAKQFRRFFLILIFNFKLLYNTCCVHITVQFPIKTVFIGSSYIYWPCYAILNFNIYLISMAFLGRKEVTHLELLIRDRSTRALTHQESTLKSLGPPFCFANFFNDLYLHF